MHVYTHLFFRSISWPLWSSFLNAGFWGKVIGKTLLWLQVRQCWQQMLGQPSSTIACWLWLTQNAQFLVAFSGTDVPGRTDGAVFIRSETNTRYVSAKNRSAIFREFCGWKGPCRVVQCNFHRFARVINISKIWCSHRLIVGFRSIFGIKFLNFRLISLTCREVNNFIKSKRRSNWCSGIGFELILHNDLPRSTWIEHPRSFCVERMVETWCWRCQVILWYAQSFRLGNGRSQMLNIGVDCVRLGNLPTRRTRPRLRLYDMVFWILLMTFTSMRSCPQSWS